MKARQLLAVLVRPPLLYSVARQVGLVIGGSSRLPALPRAAGRGGGSPARPSP